MKTTTLAFAVFLALTSFAFAENETILVTDMDDTIKNSHVLDPDSALSNAFVKKGAFLGMAELYQSLIDDKKIDEVVYLSNAPLIFMYPFHHNFITHKGFPMGRLKLNKFFSKNHKVNTLRNIINNDKPKELILVGDNGEHDTEVYDQISKEFPDLKITTYIHQAYSSIGYHNNFGKPLEENQIGWATSLDLAATMLSKDQLTKESYNNIVKEIVPSALEEGDYREHGGEIMFPAWLDCRDFKVTEIPLSVDEQAEEIVQFNKKLADRCSVEPYEN